MIAQDVLNITLMMADEVDEDSKTIDTSETGGYEARTPSILNALQTELLKQGDIFSTHEISHKPAATIVGGHDYLEFVGEDICKEGTGQAKAYYFETDGEAVVYVEDYTSTWNTLATIIIPALTKFTAYKGTLTPTVGATKSRIRFSGTYRYLATNYALFSAPFATAPDYRPWIKYTMPTDFKSVDQIISEEYGGMYIKEGAYKWEGRKDLYINYNFEGNLRITYRPIPAAVTALTSTLTVDDNTARTVMAYGLGMELYKDENEKLYNHFRNRFYELKAEATKKAPATWQPIPDAYGGWWG